MAQDHYIDIKILEEIPNKALEEWSPFSREEFMKAIVKYNNLSTSGPDKLLWYHLKYIINNKVYFGKIIGIANTYFELGSWLLHFKSSMTIVIPKPNKESYNSPKSFQLVILLNILGKLIKKVISEQLQFCLISNNFIHPCQLGGLKQRSTSDASIALMYFIHLG